MLYTSQYVQHWKNLLHQSMWCVDLNGLGMFEEWMVKEQQRSYWEGNQEGEKIPTLMRMDDLKLDLRNVCV